MESTIPPQAWKDRIGHHIYRLSRGCKQRTIAIVLRTESALNIFACAIHGSSLCCAVAHSVGIGTKGSSWGGNDEFDDPTRLATATAPTTIATMMTKRTTPVMMKHFLLPPLSDKREEEFSVLASAAKSTTGSLGTCRTVVTSVATTVP